MFCVGLPNKLRKILVTIVLLPILVGVRWWYFREQSLPNYGPAYREYAYITNGKSNTVTVIDLRTFQPARTIPVGSEPTGVAANSKKNEIYVANAGSNNISIIDAEQNKVVATLGVHGRPYFIDVSADGKRAYTANSASNNVSVIDLDKRAVISNIRVGTAPGLARVTPDGRTVVVSNRESDTASIIDGTQLQVRATLSICREPEHTTKALLESGRTAMSPGSRQIESVARTCNCVPSIMEAVSLSRLLTTTVRPSGVTRASPGAVPTRMLLMTARLSRSITETLFEAEFAVYARLPSAES